MKIRIGFMMILLILVGSVYGQKRRGSRVRLTAEQRQFQEKIDRMRMATEKVMFIDSFVVPKQQFMRYYKNSAETGTVKPTRDFLRQERHTDSYAHLNALGNKCYFALHNTDSTTMLYSSDLENGLWSAPTPLRGINEDSLFTSINYPFMMGDGQTLYFAAKGKESVGGYDIYMTTYDEESDRFLHPTNIGMPFNSEGNDYLYLIDEYDSLGWFVTDRRQPKDTVCVYVFIPSDVRETYNPEEYTPEQILSYSQLTAIADTWKDRSRLLAARKRLKQKNSQRPSKKTVGHENDLVINDELTYHRTDDFRCPDNTKRYQQLLSQRRQQADLKKSLQKSRDYYALANNAERSQLRTEILRDERRLQQLDQANHQLEKQIRQTEIIFLTHQQ